MGLGVDMMRYWSGYINAPRKQFLVELPLQFGQLCFLVFKYFPYRFRILLVSSHATVTQKLKLGLKAAWVGAWR